ncbi:hypothetical protein [Frigoriglobus tundricola]|uniref:Uncharacterized protein n=1 Tax=Frigoriglobus tundricola TaxID=2774151 RepID=A0A6M5YLU3_9BACT|nr:hypothetical protein [Frigoriglobus tundricola]QJW94273.1 hypothetical protein FTUN_1793 [Frigoriglobus tundricola]
MPEPAPLDPNFGVLFDELPPPPETIRCFLSPGRIRTKYVGAAILTVMGLGLAALFVILVPTQAGLPGCAASIAAFGVYLYLATRHVYRWVELDGDVIRSKHLYTGRIVERPIDEIDYLYSWGLQNGSLETVNLASLLALVGGMEIRFRDRPTPIPIMHADPAFLHAAPFLEAVIARMARVRPLDASFVRLGPRPHLCAVYWMGECPVLPRWGPVAGLSGFLLLPLTFGSICGFAGGKDHERVALTSVPPQEITLKALIRNGPGANRYVVITDFQPGGSVSKAKHGDWLEVSVALFPKSDKPEDTNDIQAVLWSKSFRNEIELHNFFRRTPGRIKGICSESKRSFWGLDLGPKLTEANGQRPLTAAWDIEEMSEPPSAEEVFWWLMIADFFFGTTLLVVVILLWRAP